MKNNRGITLLEVLVSMLVARHRRTGLAPLVVLSVSANNISRDVLNVSELAKDKIEQYENTSLLPALPHYEEESEVDGSIYDRITYIWDNATDTLIPASLCHIDVKISWTDQIGISHSSKFSTILEK